MNYEQILQAIAKNTAQRESVQASYDEIKRRKEALEPELLERFGTLDEEKLIEIREKLNKELEELNKQIEGDTNGSI